MRKKVLVTGGSRGLGSAIVEEFARNGYDVLFTYNKSFQEAEELKIRISASYGVGVDAKALDLERDEDIEAVAAWASDIDVLVNNAAYNDDFSLFTKKKEDLLKTYTINAVGPFLLATKLFESLKKKDGNVVNVASTNGIDTMYPESVDYDASKAALINITKNLATAFCPDVRVNAVAPGWINTDSTVDMEEKFRKREENKTLLGRFASPKEVARVVYFVASSEASYINGAVIRVDGGDKGGY